MAESHLTASELLAHMEYNPNTGLFTLKHGLLDQRHGEPGRICAYVRPGGYIQVKVKGKFYFAHRLAWLAVYGKMPSGIIDHINGNPSDNRITNLRDVSQSVNMQNRRATSNNRAGLLGVTENTTCKTFRADIKTPKGRFYLGSFATAIEAHEAYLKAKRQMHQGCTI